MSRLTSFVRLPVLLAALFFLLFQFSTTSAADKVWQTGEGNEPSNDGRPVAWLDYGVPESDAIQVRIACKAQAAGAPELDALFGAALGDLKNGAETALTFSGGGFDHEVPGTAEGVGAEVGISGVKLGVGIDDPLWDALTEQASLKYNIEGQPEADLPLKAGHRRIGNFVEACRSFVKAEPVKTAEAKTTQSDAGSSGGDISEKEAYEAAKELGTIEAWEAFLENFPKGFRADLARAYVKRIASEGGTSTDKAEEQPAETPVVEAPPPADISLAITSEESCRGGRNCSVTVTATNAGGEPFSGDLTIATSLAPGGADLQGTGTPPFSCEGAGGGAICSTGLASIAPGQSATIPMTFTLPRNAGGQVTTCASIAWGGVPASLGPADVQRKLNELGFDAGPVDGQPGRKTESAIKEFQQASGIQETGEIDLPLLLALFAPGGPGDADPVNDQACAGAAVTSALPLPAAFEPSRPSCPLGQIITNDGTCGCPSSAPFWTGKSCVPRLARNCKGGTYYNKAQKLCLCPSSRPHWYNNRCYAGVDECPGDSVRVGDKCLKEDEPGFAARPRPSGPQFGGGCKGNAIRIGNVCVNIANAPVFGGRPGWGGSGQNFTGGGNPPNRPQNTQTPTGGGQNVTQQPVVDQNNTLTCGPGFSMTLDRKSNPVCTPVSAGTSQACPAGYGQQQTRLGWVGCIKLGTKPPPPPPIVKGGGPNQKPGGGKNSKGSLEFQGITLSPGFGGGETATPQAAQPGNTGCPPGQTRVRNKCGIMLSPGPVTTQGGACPAGQIRYSKGGKCVAGKCPTNATRSGDGTCVYGLTPKTNTQQAAPPPPPPAGQAAVPIMKQPLTTKDGAPMTFQNLTVERKPGTTQVQSACPSGQIRYSKGGNCVAGKCPTNATRSGDGTCVYGLKPQPKVQQAAPPPKVKQVRPQPAPPPVVKQAAPPPPPPSPPKKTVSCSNGAFKAGPGCACRSGQKIVVLSQSSKPNGDKHTAYGCQQVAAPGVKCGAGMVAQGNTCVSAKPQGGVTKQILCPSNLVPQNGKCGCAPGLTWNGKVCAAPQQKTQQPAQQQQKVIQQQQQPQQRQCPSGMVQLPSGQCGCPGGLEWRSGKCRKPKVNFNNVIKQLQQPQQQQQQQQPPQNQQQQQIQQLNNILKQFSDARLKRDIELVATRDDGLRLYSFRYLWDETFHVGVMAQDLLADPARADAVSLHETGYYMVDYGKLGLVMTVLKDGL